MVFRLAFTANFVCFIHLERVLYKYELAYFTLFHYLFRLDRC